MEFYQLMMTSHLKNQLNSKTIKAEARQGPLVTDSFDRGFPALDAAAAVLHIHQLIYDVICQEVCSFAGD